MTKQLTSSCPWLMFACPFRYRRSPLWGVNYRRNPPMSATIQGTTTETVTASQITTPDYNLLCVGFVHIHLSSLSTTWPLSTQAWSHPLIAHKRTRALTSPIVAPFALSPSSRVLGLPSIGLPLHPPDGNDLIYNIFDSFTIPTKVKIQDKGESNSFVKFIVLFQTSW